MAFETKRNPQKSSAIGSVLLFASIATTNLVPHQYLTDIEQCEACRIDPITSFTPEFKNRCIESVVTAQDKISNLRKGGMPVSAIADAMQVERKTIYAWLRGGDVRNTNEQRVNQVHSLLTQVTGVDARGLYRFWNTIVDGKNTLRDLMTADTINEAGMESVLDNLRPAALRAIETERKMSRPGPSNAILDEIPEAGVSG